MTYDLGEVVKRQVLERIAELKATERATAGGVPMRLRESKDVLREGSTMRVVDGMIVFENGGGPTKAERKEAKRQRKEGMAIAEALGIPTERGQRFFAEGRPSRFR